MTDVQVAYDGKVHVRAESCDNCLFSKDRLVSGKRARQLIADTRSQDGSTFVCHRSQVSDEPAAICRSWWDAFAMDDWTLRLAVSMDLVETVPPAEGDRPCL